MMQPHAMPSVEISIALLSWVNDQLRETVIEREERRIYRLAAWLQNTVTVLAVGLSSLCILVLQRWS